MATMRPSRPSGTRREGPEFRLSKDDQRAQYAAEKLQQLRQRQLDLTKRNPLLKYRFSERARGQIRVVDEIPDFLFDRFAGDRHMWIAPLKPLSVIPEDEESDEFVARFEIARLQDSQYLAQLETLNSEDPEDVGFQDAERELRDRVRASLGMPRLPVERNMSRAELARYRGVNPSYELPTSNPEGDAQAHVDRDIQTLLLPQELERKASHLRNATRQALEETGLNTLYCAFGFLEWYEAEHSVVPLFAPLLLQPLQIDRQPHYNEYRYKVSGADGETEMNLALKEKVRECAVALPEMEEDETPETYMGRVADAVEKRPRWKVHRFVVIGTFSFGKLAMYHDLDPARWPAGKSPPTNGVVASLLAGTGGDGAIIGEDYPLDDPAFEPRLPVLVTDADASQLTSIIDALEGQNLVIKGPPGTGKSQTITNLIAAAMAAGRSILFVADKMAALEVVKSRLDAHGLGDFILQLHSTKARKSDVLRSIANRLDLRMERPPQELESKRRQLREERARINRYVDILNTPQGDSGKTLQEIMWAETKLRGSALPPVLERLRMTAPERFDRQDILRCRDIMAELELAWNELAAAGHSPTDHPWRGVTKILGLYEQEALVHAVTAFGGVLNSIAEQADVVTVTQGMELLTIKDLGEVLAVIRDLPHRDCEIVAQRNRPLFAALTDPLLFAAASALHQGWETASALRLEVADITQNPREALQDLTLLASAEALTRRLKADGVTVQSVSVHVTAAQEEQDHWDQFLEPVAELATALEYSALFSASDIEMILGFRDYVGRTGLRAIQQRRPDFLIPETAQEVDQIITRAASLRTQRASLQQQVDVDTKILPANLRVHAQALRGTPWFLRFLSGRFKRARMVFQQLAHDPSAPVGAAANLLVELANHLEAVSRFSNTESYSSLRHNLLNCSDTELDTTRKAVDYCLTAHRFGAKGGLGPSLSRLMMQADPDRIVSLASRLATVNQQKLDHACAAMRRRGCNSVVEYGTILTQATADWHDLQQMARDLSLHPHVTLGTMGRLRVIHSQFVRISADLDQYSTEQERLAELGFTYSATEERRRVLDLIRRLSPPSDPRINGATWTGILMVEEVEAGLDHMHSVRSHLESLLNAAEHHASMLIDMAQLDQVTALGHKDWHEVAVSHLGAWAATAAADESGLRRWVDYHRSRLAACHERMAEIVAAFESNALQFENMADAFERALWRTIIDHARTEHPELDRYTGTSLDDARKRFRHIDRDILKLCQRALRANLLARRAPEGRAIGSRRDWTGLQLLRHHAALQRPRIPIRRLMTNGSDALQVLKPCWMMSPGSVAQFLPAGSVDFDLIVIDEASQMRPEDAIVAAARGRQIVVVGDQQQLPPTSFFDKALAGSDELDDEDEIEAESILDLAIGVFHPARQLNWHYRSRHQSLIAFSNHEFYDDKLVVFPSPHDNGKDLGVRSHFVGGTYAGAGINHDEAVALSKAALEHMRCFPHTSLGVVAVNSAQADLLRMEIERRLLHDDDARSYVEAWEGQLESFFVKNLETVQGDERDTIMISTVYGPQADGGPVYQRFGPINTIYGHRRLNVLFTRAKRRIEIFTSLRPDMIRSTPNSRRGVIVLRKYLEYADTGRLLSEAVINPTADFESDFEEYVARALENYGYSVTPQVGVAGYRIDLGVRHPHWHRGYICGIECDGATYHSARCARERDALRQEILESLGWEIYRIWSTDWFNDPLRETSRLVAYLERLRSPGDARADG